MADTTITISGNLAAAPELRFSHAGNAVASFTVMLSKRQQDQGGQWQEVAANGLRCVAFSDVAENIGESLDKGARVLVTGRLEPQQWQDKTSGENRYGWQLVVNDIGPSLRWATAQPVKALRGQGGGQFQQAAPPTVNQQAPAQGQWAAQQAPQHGYQQQPQAQQQGFSGQGYDDAPPF